MGRPIETFEATTEEREALRAAWSELQMHRELDRLHGPGDRVERTDFTALRKALASLQKALAPFHCTGDGRPSANRLTLRAHWQGRAFERGELIAQDQLDARLEYLIEWLPELIGACDPVTGGAGAPISPNAGAWILCSMTHWHTRTGKKPGTGPRSRYVQALLSLQDSEPWPKVTERMVRTVAARR